MRSLLPTWGGIVTATAQDIQENAGWFRSELYTRKLLVIRGVGTLSKDELWDLHQVFGRPWTEEEYRGSLEGVSYDTPGKCITAYGNQTSAKAIGDKPMPWHRDIPWHRNRRYPIRSLYPVALTNGATEATTNFCDADVLWNRGTIEDQDRARLTKILIQSWYQMVRGLPNPQTMEIPLCEIHPVTGNQSLLLNSFGWNRPDLPFATARSGTWILGSGGDPIEGEGLEFINRLHSIVCTEDNIYRHEWQLGDLVLFDNFSGVFHNRGALRPSSADSPMHREFWRMNLHHNLDPIE